MRSPRTQSATVIGSLGSTAWAGQTARDHDNPLHHGRRGCADPLLLMLAFVVFFPGAILFFPVSSCPSSCDREPAPQDVRPCLRRVGPWGTPPEDSVARVEHEATSDQRRRGDIGGFDGEL